MSDETTPNPIDFSALDPGRNQLRWERIVQNLAAEAHAEHRRRVDVQQQLLRWARPVLAAAAALCLIVWTAGYVARPATNTSTAQVSSQSAALSLATWAANDQIPESGELLNTLGVNR
jgi:hypothetical protein